MAPEDDIIDISFDDEPDAREGGASSADNVIDISFDDDSEAAIASELPNASSERDEKGCDTSNDKRFCPDCGFALPPLTNTCPRCARIGTPSTDRDVTASSRYSPVSAPPSCDIPRRRSCAFWGAFASLALIIVVALLIAWFLVNNPKVRARTAYREGVEAQLAGDMLQARDKYLEALEIDPQMGLAAFAFGTTYLGITVGSGTSQTLQSLLERATLGQTQELDEADRWFDSAITLASDMPETRQLQDPNISTPAKLAAYAHAMKGVTALIRYAAALNADSFEVANQWLAVASYEWQLCVQFDPENPYAAQLRNQFAPSL